MAMYTLVNIDSDDGSMADGTKPIIDAMLISH